MAPVADLIFTGAQKVGQASSEPEPMPIRVNQPRPRKTTDTNEHLDGVSRLVNPKRSLHEVASDDEDPGERHYVGRLLKVADTALQTAEQPERRKRRKH